MLCKKCGNEIKENEKICSKCGEPVFETNKKNHFRKKKKLFFVVIGVVLGLVIIISFVNSLGNSDIPETSEYDSEYYDYNQEGDPEPELNVDWNSDIIENTLNVNITEDGFVDEYVDDAVLLKQYSNTCNELNPCYDSENSETGFILIWKNTDEIIPKIRRNQIVGITDSYEEVKIVPVGSSSPQYMVPLNFGNNPVEDVDDFPDNLNDNGIDFAYSNDNIDFDKGDLLKPGNPLTECNNEDLSTFVNNNCDTFVYDTNGGGWGLPQYRKYKVVAGNKNQEFVFGGYVYTEWQEFTTKACVEYYKIYANKNGDKLSKTIATKKTKNGYFSVDFSNIEPGIYYVSTYDTFIELV